MPKPNIWKVLKQRNEELGELARRIEMDPAQLSKIAAGRVTPTVPTAHRIARGLGATVDEVFPAKDEAA